MGPEGWIAMLGGIVAGCAVALAWSARRARRLRVRLGEVRERERHLAAVIRSEPACVKVVSRDLKLLEMNPAGLVAIEADSFEQVRGGDLAQVVHPEHLEDFRALNERVFAGESVTLRFRIVGLRGTERWMETFAGPMRGADGSVVAHLAVTHDVSQRVAMERRLVEARDAAIAGTRAKSEFLANMSHEIRTPMTAILGWTEVLNDVLAGDEQAVDKLAVIERNGQHLLALLSDLLDLSRIEAGKASIERCAFDPRDLLDQVRASLFPRVHGRPIQLLVEIGADVPECMWCDLTRVRQVMINLTNNALKFTESGHVILRVRVEEQMGSRSLVYEVEDSGVGIPEGQLERVLGAFEQVDAGLSRAHGGVGLGLAITRGIADLLGGSFGLVSTVGVGTTARFRLPLEAVSERPGEVMPDRCVAVEPSPQRPDLSGRRILLAEDGEDNQRLIQYLLGRAGCVIEVVGNGEQAEELALAARETPRPFDLVLMDVQMPVRDGHAATRALRARGFATPIVALTAHAMVGDRERAREAGCDGYLTKPIRAQELYAEIARLL